MILLPTLAVAFAAFCIWLTVRIVNRRERWAKWTAVLVVTVAMLIYPLSWGLYLHCLPIAHALPEVLTAQNQIVVGWGVYTPLFHALRADHPQCIRRPLLRYHLWLLQCSGAL